MRKNKVLHVAVNLLLSLLLFVSFLPIHVFAEEGQTEENLQLTIMHMNDTHAHLEPLPQMLTAIKEIRTEKENTLLLHAGDVFSGTLYFNKYKGQADLALMNLMGFDAMVYGNHEFDLGSNEGGQKSLAEFVKKANFPLLGTNLDFSSDPFMAGLVNSSPLAENATGGKTYHSIVKEIDGEKVGIFGLTTEDTISISSPMNVQFNNYLASAKDAVQKFEDAGINKIIALTHIGYDSNPAVGNDLLLAQVDGIDVIVGGHSHTKLDAPTVVTTDANGNKKDPTVIVQAHQYANLLGKLDVEFDAEGVVTEHAGQLIAVEEYAADAEASAILQPFSDEINEMRNEPSGAEAVKDLPNPRQENPGDDSVRANETELGNLVTDAMLAKAKEKFPETVIAVQNGGGIRAPIDKGPITVGEIISVLPFGNDPVVVTLTGAELKEVLEHSVRLAPGENGGFLHVSGMRFLYDSEEEAGNRVLLMHVLQDGKFVPIEMDHTYTITTNQFTAQGGDGFDTFARAYAEGRVTNIGEIDWEQLRSYMVDYLDGQVDPVREDRIIDIARTEEIPEDYFVKNVQATPDIGEVESGTKVELFTETEGADIYYTIDDTDPNDEGALLYEGPIEITKDVTIRAVAEKEGLISSDEKRFSYTVKKKTSGSGDGSNKGGKKDPNKDPGKKDNNKKDNGSDNKRDNHKNIVGSNQDSGGGFSGGILPNTATQMFNFMLYGGALLLIGIALLIYRKYKAN